MARKKNAHFIKLDETLLDDDKVLDLMEEHDYQGLGLYIAMLLTLSKKDGYADFNTKKLKRTLIADEELIRSVIQDFDLFKFTDNKFYSKRLLAELKGIQERSEKAKQSAKARWSKKDTPKQPTESNITTSNGTLDVSYNTTPQEAFEPPKQQNKQAVNMNEPCDECAAFYDKLGHYYTSDANYYQYANKQCLEEGKTPEEFYTWLANTYTLKNQYKS